MADNDLINDVGMLKGQVSALSLVASKLDVIMDRIVDQHDRHIAKVYTDMENRRLETEADIKEIHERIDMVLEKVQTTEKSILEKIESLRDCVTEHNKEEKKQLDQLLQYKWMIAGGILVLSWLISHVKPDTLGLFK
jgi:hypothetical protein